MTQTRFETTLAKPPKSTLRRVLALGSLVGHVAVGGALLALSLWEIQELKRPHRGVAMASPLAIAAPSGGGSASSEQAPERVVKKEQKKRTVKNRQPQKAPDRVAEAMTDGATGQSGEGSGTGEGTSNGPGKGEGPGGLGGGGFVEICIDPDLCDEPPPAPEALSEEPINIPEAELGRLRRKSGNPQIQPPSSTKNAMVRRGESRTVALILMCLDKRGDVSKTKVMRSSGYPEYDAKLRSSMRSWRYEPYRANGKPAAICAPLTFVYQQE